MKLNQLFLLMFLAFAAACEYGPKGLYEVEVDEITEAPNISVNLNFATDTIYLPVNGYTQLTYSTQDPKIRFAYFSLDQRQLALIESTSGSFSVQFNPEWYQTGKGYTLTVELFRSSGSGSLADKMNMEGFTYSREFTLIFENATDMAPQITKVGPADGSLKIEWEKYKGVGFIRYHVFNSVFNKITIITDQDQTSCFDPSYIGYNADYYVVTEAEGESYTSAHFFFEDGLPEATVSKLAGGKFLVAWGKNKYHNNLAGYRVFEFLNTFNELNEIAYITDLSDTSLVIDEPKFAAKTRYYIQPVAKINEITLDKLSNMQYFTSATEDLYLGEQIPIFPYAFFYNPLGTNCYYCSGYQIYKFDCDAQAFADSVPGSRIDLATSPDGSRLLRGTNNSLDLIGTQNMETVDQIPVSQLPEGEMTYRHFISNTNIGVLMPTSGNYYFYDFEARQALAQFRNEGSANHTDRMEISPDGTYFCATHFDVPFPNLVTEMYRLKNGEAQLVWTERQVTYFDFDPINNQFLFFKDKKLTKMRLDDLSTVAELNLNDEFLYDIDWNRREFLSLNDERNLFSICGLETGEIRAQLKTFSFDGYYSDFQYIFLSNKTLFTYGFYGLKLQLSYN